MISPLAIIEHLADGRARVADRLLHRAIGRCELVRNAHGHFVPSRHDADTARMSQAGWGAWAEAGFRPLHLKPLGAARSRDPSLQALLAAVRAAPSLASPPAWLSGLGLVSFYLPDAMDLREQVAAGLMAPTAAHEACRRSLIAFLEHEPRLRDRMVKAGARPAAFPMMSNYDVALRGLGRRFGSDVEAELRALPVAAGRRSQEVLFFDPKPANYIARPTDAAVWRIDLDMLQMTGSRALQVVLVYFSHPVRLERPGGMPLTLAYQFARACSCAAELGVGQDELRFALRYHLIRNFEAAWRAGDADKRLGMGQLLHAWLEVEGFGPRVRRTASALARSLAAEAA